MLYSPSYDPLKTFEENYANGPFGEVLKATTKNPSIGDPIRFLGQSVNSVIGMPAGPIFNSAFASAYFNAGFDILVYKTVRTKEKKCAPFPNIVPLEIKGDLQLQQAQDGLVTADTYAEPLSITNSFGVPSVSPDVWQPDMKKAHENTRGGQMLIGAFQGTNTGGSESDFIDDHVKAAAMVAETGVKVMEVNTSCPNEGTQNLLCFDVVRMEKIIHAIKNEIGSTPLVVKIAYFTDDVLLKSLISRIGGIADALSVINTIPGKILTKDGAQALPGEHRLWSGVCGAGIKWAGVDMVKRVKRIREEMNMKFKIIGVGGVGDAADYFEYRSAGADAVMSATGAMWNPYLAQEIKEQIKQEAHRS